MSRDLRSSRNKAAEKNTAKQVNIVNVYILFHFTPELSSEDTQSSTSRSNLRPSYVSSSCSTLKFPLLRVQDFFPKPFPCLKCGRSYRNKGSLKRHIQDECGKPPQYICSICEKGFKQKANFQRHNLTIHGRHSRYSGDNFLKPYPCFKCTRSYTNKSTLNRHLREECGKLPQYFCRYCQKAFKQRSNFQRHVAILFASISLESVILMMEPTISGWQLAVGQEGDTPICTFYQCHVCGKTYSWKSSYHRHLREECGKQERAKCKNCGRQYRWRDSLNKHLKYECGVEPKYTYSKRDLNRVNYDAPFTCYKCGKRYTWTDSLTRHLREGCGKLPRHKCTLCGRKFKRRDYLLRHENNVHKLE
ncbi:Zinc finger protein 2 [Anthophora plagiata]